MNSTGNKFGTERKKNTSNNKISILVQPSRSDSANVNDSTNRFETCVQFRHVPGLGVRTASVLLSILSVHCFVVSACSAKFSKCESNSVFSDVPNFSSVN